MGGTSRGGKTKKDVPKRPESDLKSRVTSARAACSRNKFATADDGSSDSSVSNQSGGDSGHFELLDEQCDINETLLQERAISMLFANADVDIAVTALADHSLPKTRNSNRCWKLWSDNCDPFAAIVASLVTRHAVSFRFDRR